MFAVQTLSRTAPRIANVTIQQTRNNNYIVSKPRVRVPFAEKVIHGIFFCGVPLILPMYIATKFNDWTAGMEN